MLFLFLKCSPFSLQSQYYFMSFIQMTNLVTCEVAFVVDVITMQQLWWSCKCSEAKLYRLSHKHWTTVNGSAGKLREESTLSRRMYVALIRETKQVLRKHHEISCFWFKNSNKKLLAFSTDDSKTSLQWTDMRHLIIIQFSWQWGN